MSVKVATVGMGYWGRNLVRSFHELGALGVICDTDPSRAPAARERYPDVPFVPDYAAVLADQSLDAVALATPAATHHAMARLALEIVTSSPGIPTKLALPTLAMMAV